MRRKRARTDSLELFLDTICNMFGGFIFIMLFVVVSIRATRDSVVERMRREKGAVSAVELQAMETSLDDLRLQQERLERNVESAKKFVEKLDDPELARVCEKTLRKTEELRQLIEDNARAAEELQRVKERVKASDEERERLERELDARRADAKTAREQAEDAKISRSRKTAAPQMRASFKLEVGVILKYGRLYFWHKHDGKEWLWELNDEDFVAVEETDKEIKTEPKPRAGIDLSAPDVGAKLKEAFAKCDKAKEKIVVVVAGDSYEEYSVVRDYLKREGFDIRPVTGKVGTSVADRGGTNSKAQ